MGGWIVRLGAGAACGLACAAPAHAQRSIEVTASAQAFYDSNVSRSNAARAAARGLEREDYRLTPALSADMALPVGLHLFTFTGTAGYDFYARNERLNRERLEARPAFTLRGAQCNVTIDGSYSRRGSELDDLTFGPINNTETVKSIGLSGGCQRPTGFSPFFALAHRTGRNSQVLRQISNIESDEATVGIRYSQLSLGELSLFVSYEDTTYPNRVLATPGGPRQDGFELVQVGGSLSRQIGTAVRGIVQLSYAKLEPDTGVVAGFDGLTYSAIATVNPLGRLTGDFEVSRQVDASNRFDVSYYIQENYRAELGYAISPRTQASLRFLRRDRNSEISPAAVGPLPRNERTMTYSATVQHDLTERVAIGLNTLYEKRTTTDPQFNYNRTQVDVSARVTF